MCRALGGGVRLLGARAGTAHDRPPAIFWLLPAVIAVLRLLPYQASLVLDPPPGTFSLQMGYIPKDTLAYLAFIVTAISSAAYLFKRTSSMTWDRLAGASAEIGVVFIAITLISGSLWGRITWGVYWVWDSRLTTTAFLFVTYIGYLAVRRLGGTHQQRAKRSAVLALLAVLEIPLVHFSVKLWRPLHQDATVANPNGDVKIDGLMLFSLLVGVIAFTMLYVWLLIHRQRILTMEDIVDDQSLDQALAERRQEVQR